MQSTWYKSTYSQPQGNCVEVRADNGSVQMRDSKNPNGPVLEFDPQVWQDFINSLR